MKKSIAVKSQVIGIDLGDRFSQVCVLDGAGTIVEEDRVATTAGALRRRFSKGEASRIAIEAGGHSPWVSRLLQELGHEVIVANPWRLRLIYENRRKNDKVDARYLARVARLDPKLLSPIKHRSKTAQRDLAVLHSRDLLVRTRVRLINHVRSVVKSLGARLKKTTPKGFHRRITGELPEELKEALDPIVKLLESISEQIRGLDRRIATLTEDEYPETSLLRQIRGVGPILSLAFVLTLEDPERFRKSRVVGAYLGLTPGRDQSGSSDPQRRITKQGDGYLRRLLVQGAQYILGPYGEECDLRRYGLRLAERGGRNGRKRAVIAVARKLSVLLHRLWRKAEVYEPLRPSRVSATAAA